MSELSPRRLPSQLETALDELAQAQHRSASELLEEIVREWLARHQEPQGADEERQRRLQSAAVRFVGVLAGDDPDRAQNASSKVRESLLQRHGR